MRTVPAHILRDIDATRQTVERERLVRQVIAPAAGPTGLPATRLRLKAEFNDHLRCRTWDGTTEGDVDIYVAKPWSVRHAPYDGATLTTVSASSVTASKAGETDETWVVVPHYWTDCDILAIRVGAAATGLSTAEGAAITWIELTARVWAVSDE